MSPGLLGAAQQVWADMFHGECFPAVQQGRRSKETHNSPTSRKDLQGGAAVFNVECAHAAEPFTNERCSVIGFTYVVGARTHTQGFAIVPLLLVERIQTTHSGAQVLGGHFSQPQSCCRLQASAMSKQHPVACIPKSRKTSCSLALLICPSILLVHIGISV